MLKLPAMTGRTKTLLSVFVVLGLVYLFAFTGLFSSQEMRIQATLQAIRPPPKPRPGQKPRPYTIPDTFPVVFNLDGRYELLSVRVDKAEYAESGATDAVPPLWHLVVADPAKPPATRAFRYGDRINGMKPADDKSPTEPLQAGTKYRLTVEAKQKTGHIDFETKAVFAEAAVGQ